MRLVALTSTSLKKSIEKYRRENSKRKNTPGKAVLNSNEMYVKKWLARRKREGDGEKKKERGREILVRWRYKHR